MIVARGAEAVLKKEGNLLVKERIKKDYRIDEIDLVLRKQRTKREAKSIQLANTLIPSPKLHNVDEKTMIITMDYLNGDILRDIVHTTNRTKIFTTLGKMIKTLHDANLIHGDLTTSNVIIVDGVPHLIDFGLSCASHKIEDKAVDVRLFKQALQSKHYEYVDECFEAFLQGYQGDTEFLERFDKVEGRGRYKQKQM